MERRAIQLPGFVMLLLTVAVAAIFTIGALMLPPVGAIAALVVGSLIVLVLISGLVVNNPNEAKVVQFFGKYVGSIRDAGFWWTMPLASRRTVGMRVRNFETAQSKVNDANGNPVEIAAVVVWRVTDSAKAIFSVDSFLSYVSIQSETALRHLATCYPYDSHGSDRMSLRDGAQVAEELTLELRERIAVAGVEVIESRITHLAYAPEIAQAMLRRQQASAVVAARQQIVEGAVGMVQTALETIAEQEVVELDEERKSAMVSNLLVVLCSDQSTQPVVNTGSLYT
ncbi:MAG TPA: SPFH domain-containing protein [Candidatus Stackebrandtia faecavium]|nr:SPFH domain-containing protein [Candidatus Stackebrandtia faecavium]